MPKKTAKKKAVKPKPVVKKGPRQDSLPGMQDRAISALEEAALRYDEVKKERMELTKYEVEGKREVSRLMHKAKKTHYHRGNILVDIVPEGEKVKVKVLAAGEE